MDSGTRDGTPADELARLSSTGGQTELNPTAAQPGPTPRTEQQADDEEGAGDRHWANGGDAGSGGGWDDGGSGDDIGGVMGGNAFAKLLNDGLGPGGGPLVSTIPFSALDGSGGLAPAPLLIGDAGSSGREGAQTMGGSPKASKPSPPNDAGPPSMWNADEWIWLMFGDYRKFQRPDGTWGWEQYSRNMRRNSPTVVQEWAQDMGDDAAAAAGLAGVPQAYRALKGGNAPRQTPSKGQNPEPAPPSASNGAAEKTGQEAAQTDKGWVRPKGWQLPKNGKWDGTPGDSNFTPNNPAELGLKAGEAVPFRNGRPDFSKWSKGNFTSEQPLTGDPVADRTTMIQAIAKEKGWTQQQVKD